MSRPRHKARILNLGLTEEIRTRLTECARPSRTAPAHYVERSVISWHLLDHQHDVSELAGKLHIDRQRVVRLSRDIRCLRGSSRWDRSTRSSALSYSNKTMNGPCSERDT